MHIDKAKQIANATEWSGDIRVNFLTVHKAANCLAKEVERLELALDKERDALSRLERQSGVSAVRW